MIALNLIRVDPILVISSAGGNCKYLLLVSLHVRHGIQVDTEKSENFACDN